MRNSLRFVASVIIVTLSCVTAEKLFDDVDTRIVGGEEVEDESIYPWYIKVEIFDQLNCGASLIHSLWVLTAAHCFNTLRMEANHWINRTKYAIDPDAFYIHPQYQSVNYLNDIMLIRLSQPIQNSEVIELNNNSSYPVDGQELTVVSL